MKRTEGNGAATGLRSAGVRRWRLRFFRSRGWESFKLTATAAAASAAALLSGLDTVVSNLYLLCDFTTKQTSRHAVCVPPSVMDGRRGWRWRVSLSHFSTRSTNEDADDGDRLFFVSLFTCSELRDCLLSNYGYRGRSEVRGKVSALPTCVNLHNLRMFQRAGLLRVTQLWRLILLV